MKKILSLFFTLSLIILQAQKNTAVPSCLQLKQHLNKAVKSTHDSRGDSVDILHTKLNIDISDWSGRRIVANAQIDFEAKQNISRIALDLLKLQVDSVKQGLSLLNFTYNDTLIEIDLLNTLSIGQQASVTVYYQGSPIQNSGDWGGFFWNNTYAFNIGVSFVEDPHNYGRAWFPCFDNFEERCTYETIVTTDDSRKAFCGGFLQSEIDNLDGTVTWHWMLNQEIPSYLASIAVSDYATVNMAFNGVQSAAIPIQLAARASDTIAMKGSFINLTNALECYEEHYAPYAFDRVGYCVTSFTAGAMEHATNIAYMRNAINGSTSQETLMAHELSHSWWGNLVTCSTAEDMWLNEGWASFSEALFIEYVYGEEAYKDFSRANHDKVLRLTHINDGGYYAVSGVPSELTYSSTVYDKGADMAHTLRGILGENYFDECIHDFLSDFAFKDISSSILEAYFSNCSGKDLTSFFDSWIFEPGFHHFSIANLAVVQEGATWSAEGTIKQKLWENTTYTTSLPIEVSFFDAQMNRFDAIIYAYDACSSFNLTLPFDPIYYALDMEERIQDATVDQYKFVNQLGTNDFELARVILEVQEITDSALVHVTHHYIKPDPLKTPIAGMHLSPNRYWSIGGVWNADFKTNAIFRYNGSSNQTSGHLDNNFINISEDSLVLLYKVKPSDDWQIVDSFSLNTQGSVMNKVGYFEVFDLQAGDYVMAIYNKQQLDDIDIYLPCLYSGLYKQEQSSNLVKVYPVPASSYFKIEILDLNKEHLMLSVTNIMGKEVFKQRIKAEDKIQTVKTNDWAKGNYILSLLADRKIMYSTKILIE
jgi:aminopeptidase N